MTDKKLCRFRSMTYKLKFHPDALKEWHRLRDTDKSYFKNKLAERLKEPHIPSAKLTGGINLYKIKRKRPPLRLTYHVNDTDFIVITT
ncbi:type II toxin-antitoxin system RelE/ParE family toxin [Aliidiomarina taiwanensis]